MRRKSIRISTFTKAKFLKGLSLGHYLLDDYSVIWFAKFWHIDLNKYRNKPCHQN